MRSILVGAILIAMALSGCISDDGGAAGDGAANGDSGADEGAPGGESPDGGSAGSEERQVPADADWDGLAPHRDLPATITNLTEVARGETPGGQGIWLWNDRAYVSRGGGRSEAVGIYDISDPLNPLKIGNISAEHSSTGNLGARDIDILNYGDRTLAAISQGGPLIVFDVTLPAFPFEVARFNITSHNLAVHRPAHLIYNSVSLGDPPGYVEIFDATDPDDISLARVWEFEDTAADGTPVKNTGCHDISVYPDQKRAYCGGVTQTMIWDISDPMNPIVMTTIDNPAINIHHSAFTILNHTVLVVGDEYGGAAVYACYGNQEGPDERDVSSPTGAVWFYDITITPPVLLGWLSPPALEEGPAGGTCTAHFGAEVGEGTGYLAYGWYNAGTLLIDATDPSSPHLVTQFQSGGVTWDARYYRGYVYTGDGGQGLGVLMPK